MQAIERRPSGQITAHACPAESTSLGAISLSRRSWVLPALAIFPFIAAFLLMRHGADAWQIRFSDPDDYMRLVQIRAWLSGQAWWDLTQYRINPPEGVKLHWSRLADIPYAIPITALSLVVSPALAEKLAVVAVPLILLLGTILAVTRTSAHLAGTKAAIVSCFLVATSVMILVQFRPGRLDHHGLQMLLLAGTLTAIVGKDSFRSGLAAAFCASASIAIGLETAPYLAAIALWHAARWVVRGEAVRAPTLGFSAGMALFLPLFLILLTPNSDWFLPTSDALGRGHALAALLGGGTFALLITRARVSPQRGRIVHCLVAGLAACVAVAIFREIVSAPYSEVDPLLQKLWLDQLGETRSIAYFWRQGPLMAIGEILFLVMTLAATALLIRGSRGRDRDMYALFALLGVIGLVLTCWQARAGSLAHMAVIPPAAAAIALLWKRWREGRGVLGFAGALVALNPALGSTLPLVVHDAVKGPEKLAANANEGTRKRCDVPADAHGLAALPPGLIVNPIDLSAMLLTRTPHAVYTSSNHRSYPQNRNAYLFFTARPERARALSAIIGARYFVYCPSAQEVRNLVNFAPSGLLAELAEGRTPQWLIPVAEATRGGLHVYEFTNMPKSSNSIAGSDARTSLVHSSTM